MLLQGCSAQKNSQLINAEMETVVSESLGYYLYFPEDYEDKSDENFPLLLFLHGGGESGDSLSTIKSNGPPKLIVEGKQFPFLILAPQNPYKKKWWNTRAVAQLLDTIVENNVSIGAGCTILPGITLGEGCLIGAGSVVTKNIPKNATAYGNPAKIIIGSWGAH